MVQTLSAKRSSKAPLESLLVADLGQGTSRAYLLEQIGGAFRFVAKVEGPTTADLPFEDLMVGWNHLLAQLEWESGRRLTERDGVLMPQQERGDGVDGLVVCSTLPEPVGVAILAGGTSPVTAIVLESLARTYARVHYAVAPSRDKDGRWMAGQVEDLRRFQPEQIIIIGGEDDHGTLARLHQVVRQVVAVPGDQAGFSSSPVRSSVKGAVIVAEKARQGQFSTVFGPKIATRFVAPSERPPVEIAAEIEREVVASYLARVNTSDFADLARDATAAPMARPQAVDLVNRYLARAFGRRVITIGIDDGTHLHWAAGESGQLAMLHEIDLGVGITGLTSDEVIDAARWLPFPIEESALIEWVLNRAVRPWSPSLDPRDAAIELALVRQIARRGLLAITQVQPMALPGADLLVGGPCFGRATSPGAAALALLDCVDVVPDHGVVDLALDQDGLMTVAGAVGAIDPAIAADIFEYDTLIHLGSAVVIGGPTHAGELACRGEIHFEHGGTSSFSVASGEVEILPLRPGETASLVLRPERRYAIGGHAAGKSVTFSDDRRIIGGTAGVIIDARGRSLASGPSARPANVKRWLDAVDGSATPLRRTA